MKKAYLSTAAIAALVAVLVLSIDTSVEPVSSIEHTKPTETPSALPTPPLTQLGKPETRTQQDLKTKSQELISTQAPSESSTGKRIRDFFSGKLTEKQQLAFWDLVRNTPEFAQHMEGLEKKIESSPEDLNTRRELAQTYVAKLLSLPNSPEKGIWAAKAERQWEAILDYEPQDWKTRHNLAFSLSQYPDFLNRQDDAINHYEQLLEQQTVSDPEPEFPEIYVELSRLYLKQGDRESARQAVAEGLSLYPADEQLARQGQVLNSN